MRRGLKMQQRISKSLQTQCRCESLHDDLPSYHFVYVEYAGADSPNVSFISVTQQSLVESKILHYCTHFLFSMFSLLACCSNGKP